MSRTIQAYVTEALYDKVDKHVRKDYEIKSISQFVTNALWHYCERLKSENQDIDKALSHVKKVEKILENEIESENVE